MRTILLALLTVLVLAPQAADAARRDERGGTTASRTNAAASPASRASTRATPRSTSRAAATRSPAAARSTPRATTRAAARTTTTRAAARTTTRAAARTTTRAAARGSRSAARPTSRAARSQANARQATVRRGDVRTQRGGVVVRGAAAATISRRSGIAGWQAGLPAVTMAQRDCPVGTFATLARGHDDIVRCMPL
ncbi:hypothetical protein HB662_06995 [Roseomonas frigidaquae]|uniref:Uncharacterized protein n=1 Tax=Falsiroseomonas frigidaquae TaxID=487318 RepID=A0ABX1EWQ1_9PROT|nr:hypothetical protein [Falsiroseomonas frigidaquae]NKE44517.1 hypothetical protein [Falsiroseomonas frigidaquae]